MIAKIFATMVLAMSVNAHADSAQLKIDGDLMVHPKQVAGFFEIAAGKIGASPSWDWPSLNFTRPYRTSWSAVQARGPFNVRFSTANLDKQEVGFELDWNDPLVHVGHFEIHDTIVRDVGGARIIIVLDGTCSNMQVRIPNGQWKVRGTLKWNWTPSGLQVNWQDFAFASSGAPTAVDLGHCTGPAGLNEALRDAIHTASRDNAWMQDILRDGVLDWVEGSLGSLQQELMKTREVNLRPGLVLTWQPNDMGDSGNGLIRIGGQMILSKQNRPASEETLHRTYTAATLAGAQESGFVLPKDTLPKMIGFLQANGELGYRAESKEISAFQGLMKSRFLQFFVWPDLLKFAKTTQFYFDVSAEKVPSLTNGRAGTHGVVYDVQAPLLVKQWAPTATAYVPYVDFRSPMTGQMSAHLENGELKLQVYTNKLNVSSQFRTEFSKFRKVTTRISNSLLGSRVADYLNSKPLSLKVPDWTLGDGLSLGMKDLKLQSDSFVIPLEFKQK